MDRRQVLQGLAGAVAGPWLIGAGRTRAAPELWAPLTMPGGKDPDRYTALEAEIARKAVDIRSFGARCNGVDDDSAAFDKAISSGAEVLLLPEATQDSGILLQRQVCIDRPLIVAGAGKARVIWAGRENQAFKVAERNLRPDHYVGRVWFDGVAFRNWVDKPRGHAVLGLNVRGLRFTRCRTHFLGGLYVESARRPLGLFGKVEDRSLEKDPAIGAGFSATGTDDLNEDILVADNRIDGGAFKVHIVRFNFARRVGVYGNVGEFANISWWGGGAKANNGGMPQFLRRVRDVHIADNQVAKAQGGIYGNNGQNVLIERNQVSDITDTGIDFEGCIDCEARDNTVRNCGNFCYSVFYVASNIRFINNTAIQDGSGSGLAKRFGGGKIGKMPGHILFASIAPLKTAKGSVTLTVHGNRFIWQGADGLGTFKLGQIESASFIGNRFENVSCDLSRRDIADLRLADNNFTFSKPALAAARLVGASVAVGGLMRVDNNGIQVSAAQPEGSIGLYLGQPWSAGQAAQVQVTKNRVAVNDPSHLQTPILLETDNPLNARHAPTVLLADNTATAIYLKGSHDGLTEQNNRTPGGAALQTTVRAANVDF